MISCVLAIVLVRRIGSAESANGSAAKSTARSAVLPIDVSSR